MEDSDEDLYKENKDMDLIKILQEKVRNFLFKTDFFGEMRF